MLHNFVSQERNPEIFARQVGSSDTQNFAQGIQIVQNSPLLGQPSNGVNVTNLQNTSQQPQQPLTSLNLLDIGSGVSDDDFFHLTCHIEPGLIHKIEKGEFVELEKLLPKDKFAKGDEGRMEWVHRDGGTFLVPAQRDSKINGFRHWEQAFRAYATIYCGANPHR